MGTTSHQYNPTSFYSDYRYHGILTYKHNLSSFYRGLHCTKSYQLTKSKFFNDDLHDTTCYQYYQTSFYSETRAPRGTDRSPEYNEHFCYKLDSRVKNLTTEWNQKQHFITHASRSLLRIRFVAVAFRSEEVF